MAKLNRHALPLLLIAALVFPLPLLATPTDSKPAPLTLTNDENLILSCVNAERRAKGLPALTLDPILVLVAREHSADMAKRGYFSHVEPGPKGRTPLDRYALALGREPRTVVGENLGCCDAPMMGLIHQGMMTSADHRANILDREYVSVGVGVYALDDGRVWVTQMFRGELPKTR